MYLPAGYNDIKTLLRDLKTKPEQYWIERGERMALKLFHETAARVPAYKDFLKKNNINEEKIKTIQDFSSLPTVNKDNYLRAYPLPSLSWDGELNRSRSVFASTSGSTGEPFYFPRREEQDEQYALTAELYLLENFQIDKKSTLYIDGFAMGAWIGGLFTYEAITKVARRGGYALSIITPGIFKYEILKAIKKLGHLYDQVIIAGYPPFVKDTIDLGIEFGIDWSAYKIGFIFSAEGFSEEFREYILRKAGVHEQYKSSLNHYGTVDLGTMAHETAACIALRKLAINDEQMHQRLFGRNDKLPTLAQYVPELFFFQSESSELICTANSGLPLVRYDLKDQGGVVLLQAAVQSISSMDAAQWRDSFYGDAWKLPMVYVFERSDFTVKLFGANIYPETIRKALLETEINDCVTGKFMMSIQFDLKQNQFLQVRVELRPKVESSAELESRIQGLIVKNLLKENSEFQSNYKEAPAQQIPSIVLSHYEEVPYFNPGTKQRWVEQTNVR